MWRLQKINELVFSNILSVPLVGVIRYPTSTTRDNGRMLGVLQWGIGYTT